MQQNVLLILESFFQDISNKNKMDREDMKNYLMIEGSRNEKMSMLPLYSQASSAVSRQVQTDKEVRTEKWMHR